ncbi:MarR family winged helix-turn-helix transcriptional regulator [Curvivirga sp.]|uniref:MarR family winged helix-turn-helix transcriptional regulator n=1 Tax=Curvivirga sp. TaxID=2856848 RepID=UPI003B59B642
MEEKYSLQSTLKRYEENWPEMALPESEAVVTLMRLNDIMTEATNQTIHSLDISHLAFEVLVTLRSYPAPHQVSPTDLYKSVLCSSGGMTKVLKSLEDDGYISRMDNLDDKRSKLVQLTATGITKAEEVMEAVCQGDKAFFTNALDDEEIKSLNKLLRLLVQKLEGTRNL